MSVFPSELQEGDAITVALHEGCVFALVERVSRTWGFVRWRRPYDHRLQITTGVVRLNEEGITWARGQVDVVHQQALEASSALVWST